MCFSQSKSTKCEIFVWNCDFFWNCYLHRLKTCSIGFGICQTLHMCYSSHFNAFVPVKINKMWNFLSEIVIFTNHLSQRLKTCSIGFGIPQTLNTHHSSNFNALFPVKINKMWNFGCVLNSPDKKLKNHQFAQGKSVHKDLQICTYRVSGYANCNALCYNFVWQVLFELLWFFCICYGKVKI